MPTTTSAYSECLVVGAWMLRQVGAPMVKAPLPQWLSVRVLKKL